MRFVNAQGFGGGDEFFTYLKDSFDVLYKEGETAPKMMSSACIAGSSVAPAARRRLRGFSTTSGSRAGLGADQAGDRPALHANLAHLADNAFDIG